MNATRLGLSASQRDFFLREGYLVVEDVLDPARDFKLLVEEHGNILNRLAARHGEAGDIDNYDPGASFEQRVLHFTRSIGDFPIQEFDICLPQKVINSDTGIYLGDGAFSILTHPLLLDLVESLIGAEITVSPIQHIRIKTPLALADRGEGKIVVHKPYDGSVPLASQTTVPHQDIGVQTPDADASEVITVWIPLTDATAEMGCLGVWPRRHPGGVLNHCPNPGGLEIVPQLLDDNDFLPLPMRAGSVLFMTRFTPHKALPNLSDKVRWSMDLRYQPTGQISGRASFPEFVARTASGPSSALVDHNAWRERWLEARARLAGQTALIYNRWSSDAPWCA
jgi:ectoine hydroxylase-related dioxygenase (phytanoyl-CoA dioxygenase family)